MTTLASRLPCDDCGSSDALAEYANGTYCFSCQRWTRKSTGSSFAVSMQDLGEVAFTTTWPFKTSDKLPPQALKWLWQYNITDEQISLYEIKHAQVGRLLTQAGQKITFRDRVILTQRRDMIDSVIEFYQTRQLADDGGPKYYTSGNKKFMFWANKQQMTNYVVLTEDIISAIRVGEVASAVSLLGTKLDERQLLTLIKKYDTIIVWMDGDKAGKTAADKITSKLKLVTNVRQITTNRDPKCFSRIEIEQLINEVL